MSKPNFFIVGAPKCGTTALSEYLKGHPNVFMSTPKEPHYFATDMPKKRAISNESDYLKLFSKANKHHLAIGEASVWYLYSNEAIYNIKQFYPDSKIIVMIRNPVDLVYSMHSQGLYTRNEDERHFSKAWNLSSNRKKGRHIPHDCKEAKLLFYDEIGRLGEQLERVNNTFPPQQIKVIFFEDFVKDTKRVYREVLDFLNIPDDCRQNFPIINSNKQHRIHWLSKLTRRPPTTLIQTVEMMKKACGLSKLGIIEKIEKLNRLTVRRPALERSMRQKVIDAYRDDIKKLACITGRDLSSWLEPG